MGKLFTIQGRILVKETGYRYKAFFAKNTFLAFVSLLFISGGFAQNKDFHPWCLALIHGAVFIHECSLNGKLFRLSIMYEFITCFHEFCNYEYIKNHKVLFVYFSLRYVQFLGWDQCPMYVFSWFANMPRFEIMNFNIS